MNVFDHWALSGVIFVPILGAILMGFLPRAQETAQKSVALLTSLVTGGLMVGLLARFSAQPADPAPTTITS